MSRLLRSGLLSFIAFLSGCLGMQGQSTIDLIYEQTQSNPFVEAYIEYSGPNARWAGPTTFSVRVLAKEAGAAEVSVSPSLFKSKAVVTSASATSLPSMAPSNGPSNAPSTRILSSMDNKVFTSEMAREQLAFLAISMQDNDKPFKGCVSPVRARLIKSDGSILEKNGCRGQQGWVMLASALVDRLINAVVYGVE